MADLLTLKEIIIAEALRTHALICYIYNTAACIPEKFYLESKLYKLDNFPITTSERYILSTEKMIKTVCKNLYI